MIVAAHLVPPIAVIFLCEQRGAAASVAAQESYARGWSMLGVVVLDAAPLSRAGDEVGPDRQPDHPGGADQAAAQHLPRLAPGQATRCSAAPSRVRNARFGMRRPEGHPARLPIRLVRCPR